ncbi:hypothetical protein RJT34_03714 [Clitoria ternatea]|uniref:Uncharacterized protein n=1 Tax=Clitoria ternatea TaxID=43366 RepID=A0AAN9KJX6_CLITE
MVENNLQFLPVKVEVDIFCELFFYFGGCLLLQFPATLNTGSLVCLGLNSISSAKLKLVVVSDKLMQSLKFLSPLFNHFSSHSLRSLLSPLSTLSSSTSKESASVIDYLNANFNFSTTQSVYISKRVSGLRLSQHPFSVLTFFKQIGLSEAQIVSTIRQKPQLLFSDLDQTLRPKVQLFQRLGLEGFELASFISKNSSILTSSLKKTLVPSVEAIRKIVNNDKDFIHVLHRCGWILPKYKRFMDNVAFLESCGIVGSQLSMLLKVQSRLFAMPQSKVRNYVLRAVDLGFHENSRMLVHAVHTISALSYKTFRRKLELIHGFGFSNDESMQMFKRCPTLPRTSEKKLKLGIEFFLYTAMLPKSLLVQRPMVLMYSIEDRVLPRYRVLQLLLSKKLCGKVPSYVNVLCLSESVFLCKYIFRFRENAEELLVAYRGHRLNDMLT